MKNVDFVFRPSSFALFWITKFLKVCTKYKKYYLVKLFFTLSDLEFPKKAANALMNFKYFLAFRPLPFALCLSPFAFRLIAHR